MAARPTERIRAPGTRLLVAAGLGEGVLLALLGWWEGADFPLPGVLLFAGSFCCYALGARVVAAWGSSDAGRAAGYPLAQPEEAEPSGVPIAWVVWSVALALRAVFLPLDPVLSDDVYRYLWDGWVQLQGTNPYLHAPADPALAPFRTAWHSLINNPDVPTIYPPVAQYAFVLVAFLGSTIPAAKLVWLAADLGTGVLLSRVARKTGRRPSLTLLLYLWSPLLVVETAWSGHLEALGLFWMALLLLQCRRPGNGPVGAGVALALAALTKLAPAAALPPLARRLGSRFVLAFGLVALVAYLPFADAGAALWTGLGTYAEHWRFNEGAFLLLEALLPPGRPPRIAAALLVLAVVAWTTLRRFGPERALFWILGTGLLLSPTVHPWYVLWALPFAALRVSRPWLLLSGLVFLGYWGLGSYQRTGIWPQPAWLGVLIWGPFYALLALDAWAGQGLCGAPEPTQTQAEPA